MLSARKLHLAAGLKVSGLSLRKAELDFYMLRYISVAGISSILTGLSYVALIKIKIPEVQQPPHTSWQVFAFYTCTACTMAFALFNLVVTSFLVVNAQGLTLRGPPNAVAKCVEILAANWNSVRIALALSLLALLATVLSIVWMKLEEVPLHPGPAIWCTVVVVVVLGAAVARMTTIAHEMRIEHGTMVAGDLTVTQQSEAVDLLSEANAVIPISRN